MPRRRRFDHDEAARRYLEGESLSEIAAALGVTDGAIYQALRRQGLQLRGNSEAQLLRAARTGRLARHGTETMYVGHRCRCDDCREAMNAARRARNARDPELARARWRAIRHRSEAKKATA